MPELLRMPEVAAGSGSAKLAEWLMAEQQAYTTADSLAAVETDKAVVDFLPETDGVLLRHLVAAGTDVPVGEPIALVAAPGEVVTDIDAAVAALAGGGPAAADRHDPAPTVSPAPTAAPAPGAPLSVGSAPGGTARIFTSPLARRLAEEAGIPVESITGTGPFGRIVRADVERAIAEGAGMRAGGVPTTPPGPTAPAAPPAPPARASAPAAPARTSVIPASPGTSTAGYREVPHTRMRRAIAARLTASQQTVPHFTVAGSARVDELLAIRSKLSDGCDVKVSVNDLVLKAVGRAHRQVPEANVIWTEDAMRHFDAVDVGMAVVTDGGLVTPVVRGVDRLSISAVAEAAHDMVERARAGRLREHELEGGSITVTNLGMFGVEAFSAIINPPQAAILAVGAARLQPVVGDGGEVQVRAVIRVTLSVDHRAIDGALAARWMAVAIDLLEHPLNLLV